MAMTQQAPTTDPCDCQSSCATRANACARALGAPGSTHVLPPSTVAAVASSGVALSACALCCVVPLAWPSLLVGFSASAFAWSERSQPYLAYASLLVVVVGWVSLYRRAKARGGVIGDGNAVLMLLATVMTGGAILWREIEPHLIAALERA